MAMSLSNRLGYAGLIPFVVLMLWLWLPTPPLAEVAVNAFISYSAVILSFLCGSLWGQALADSEGRPRPLLLSSNIILLVGWGGWGLAQTGFYLIALLVLTACFIAVLISEWRYLELKGPYARLRLILTLVVALCHGLTALALYTP